MSTQNQATEEQQKDMSPGIFSWNELMTDDPEASADFYSGLFGWTAETMDMGQGREYTFFKLGDRPAGGMMQLPPEARGMSPSWMAYVTVEDLSAAVARAKELGAEICKDITIVPGMGSLAIINDPQGAMLGLWEFAKK